MLSSLHPGGRKDGFDHPPRYNTEFLLTGKDRQKERKQGKKAIKRTFLTAFEASEDLNYANS